MKYYIPGTHFLLLNLQMINYYRLKEDGSCGQIHTNMANFDTKYVDAKHIKLDKVFFILYNNMQFICNKVDELKAYAGYNHDFGDIRLLAFY